MGYFFVLGILAKSKDIKNKFELARELQRKMREGIKEVIKSDKVNFNGKIAIHKSCCELQIISIFV